MKAYLLARARGALQIELMFKERMVSFISILALAGLTARAEVIPVGNSSFESPSTEFVDLRVDGWQKTPKPDWFVESPQQQWDQLAGVFKNTAPGAADHIDNVEGNQAVYLFSVPQAGLVQELEARFEVGKSYRLTVGVVGGGGNMPEGASLLASLYYVDAASNAVTVASNVVVMAKATFPVSTHLVDFQVALPAVKGGEGWAGKKIGLMFVSTVAPDKVGGYWDLDNVRLEAVQEYVPVANYSFESPGTEFVDLRVDGWLKAPKPDWFVESPQQQWDQLVGVFKNTAPGSADRIDNVEGNQAVYLFSVPQAGFAQELDGKFEAGKSYRLTVGVVGGGGNMPEGASLLASVYYLDAASNVVTIASNAIVHTKATFPVSTHLVDFEVAVPAVKLSDAWAAKKIGVMFVSTVAPDKVGGYWDLDNVRVQVTRENVPVPNYSFELPETQFVDLTVASWQKFPKPDWFVESPQQQWSQLVGVFKNTDPGSADRIDNVEGKQAIYLFAVPQAGFFQDYNSIGGTNTSPGHQFDARFEAGQAYRLTVGVVGGGGNMAEGVTMLASLYYADTNGLPVTVAATTITNSKALFPTSTHLVDFEVSTARVAASDAWAGKNIGIMFVSTTAPDKAGGYWDLDNVRLSLVAPASVALRVGRAGDQLTVAWSSVAGTRYRVQSSVDLKTWSAVGEEVAGTGSEVSRPVTIANGQHRFFRVQENP